MAGQGPIGPIGPPGGRAAGERAGLVDFNNYKTSNRLQDFQQTTRVPGHCTQSPNKKTYWKKSGRRPLFPKTRVPTDDNSSNRWQQFQQMTTVSTDDNSFNWTKYGFGTFSEMSGRHVGYVRDIFWQLVWHIWNICWTCLEYVFNMSWMS